MSGHVAALFGIMSFAFWLLGTVAEEKKYKSLYPILYGMSGECIAFALVSLAHL